MRKLTLTSDKVAWSTSCGSTMVQAVCNFCFKVTCNEEKLKHTSFHHNHCSPHRKLTFLCYWCRVHVLFTGILHQHVMLDGWEHNNRPLVVYFCFSLICWRRWNAASFEWRKYHEILFSSFVKLCWETHNFFKFISNNLTGLVDKLMTYIVNSIP